MRKTELTESVFCSEKYEKEKDLGIASEKSDYLISIRSTFDLDDVSNYNEIVNLDHDGIQNDCISIFLKNGNNLIIEKNYDEFKKLIGW